MLMKSTDDVGSDGDNGDDDDADNDDKYQEGITTTLARAKG